MKAVVLAGGTGGAKLARGMLDLVGPDLTVIANTGDDIEIHGVHVSPDPDLITYWLADEIDAERGWGLRDDSFAAFERLRELGSPDWFALGDRDLAVCLRRTEMLRSGRRLTEAQATIASSLGIEARVLPMSDERVETRVLTAEGWRSFQEYLILDRCLPPIEGYELAGIEDARPSAEVLEALAEAECIVIGPSNPIASIGPILGLAGMREALAGSPAPVVAVSPFVGGRAIKGPTEAFMRAAGEEAGPSGVVSIYGELIDSLLTDTALSAPSGEDLRIEVGPTRMADPASRRRVAEAVLELAAGLA